MRHLLWKRILFLSLSILCVLSFASLGSTAPCGNLSFPEGSDSTYRSLADALTANKFCADHLPTWIPKDFSIENIDEKSNSKMYRISAEYVSLRGSLQIRALITSNNVLHFMEKDTDGYKILHNDLEIYLYTNQENYRASWFADDIIFTVSFYPNSPDSITEQEFLMIVESIPK